MLVDLTHAFTTAMPVYPGDPAPELRQVAALSSDGYNGFELRTGMHVGTHMDAPRHILDGGALISEIPAERLVGRGVLLKAAGRPSIDVDLLRGLELRPGDVVLVNTGHHHRYGLPDYFSGYPEISAPFAEALADAAVSIVGLDTPSPDRAPFPLHKVLLSRGVLIVENLTNLDALDALGPFDVAALPMRAAADGAPVRVLALSAV